MMNGEVREDYMMAGEVGKDNRVINAIREDYMMEGKICKDYMIVG